MVEPRGISCLSSVIIRAREVFRKTDVGDWRFDYLSGSHRRQMMVFMPLVVVWIGQFCRDMIGRQNVKVVVIGRLLFCCYFRPLWLITEGTKPTVLRKKASPGSTQ